MDIVEGNSVGSVLFVQCIGDISPVPMKIYTKDGLSFPQMEMHLGFQQLRKDETGDVIEILFFASDVWGRQLYFRWVKPGHTPELLPRRTFYFVHEIDAVEIGSQM